MDSLRGTMRPVATVRVSLLGTVLVELDGRPVPLPGPRQRALVATLALRSGVVVSTDALVESIWGDEPPQRAEHSLQQQVSTLRKSMEAVADASAVITRPPGYLLVADEVDALRSEQDIHAGVELLDRGRWEGALEQFDRALGRWRGPTLADARTSAALDAQAVRLDELRLNAVERRADALLAGGRNGPALAQLEALVAEHPFRERARASLMLTLYRSGRQADALAVFRQGREVLIEELGIEPGPELRELEQAILEQRAELSDAPAAGDALATFRADLQEERGQLVLPDGQVFRLVDGVVVLGRDASAGVRLVDNRVSRRHARIEVGAGGCVLVDEGSTNGTTVDDRRVTREVLVDGSRVGLGGVELVFRAAGAPAGT